MNYEIERKFLINGGDSFKQMASSHSHIKQGYMDVKGATVRIRLRDDKAYLTIKGKSADGGLSRYEFEREIPVDDANIMLTFCQGGMIDKTRWLVPYEGHTFEVDEFHGDNDGLVFCEVELDSPDEEFARPPFLGKEVTGNAHFYNSNLLRCPYCLWKDELINLQNN